METRGRIPCQDQVLWRAYPASQISSQPSTDWRSPSQPQWLSHSSVCRGPQVNLVLVRWKMAEYSPRVPDSQLKVRLDTRNQNPPTEHFTQGTEGTRLSHVQEEERSPVGKGLFLLWSEPQNFPAGDSRVPKGKCCLGPFLSRQKLITRQTKSHMVTSINS